MAQNYKDEDVSFLISQTIVFIVRLRQRATYDTFETIIQHFNACLNWKDNPT